MILKTRTESEELTIFKSLNVRRGLTTDEKMQYTNLQKGYEGEVKFDSWMANLDSNVLVLNDLLLESNNTTFQIDSLLITRELIVPCEVKNNEGDYFYQEDNFYKCKTRRKITNPLHQLNRIEVLLGQILQNHKLALPIKGNLVFINPEFFLYQAPQNKKIIFTPQLPQFIKSFHENSPNLGSLHRKIAELLLRIQVKKPRLTQLPSYHYEQLKKGIPCDVCQSFQINVSERKLVCEHCGHKEKIETAVLRCIEEFKLLFPEKHITTKAISDWCQPVKSKKTIWRILKQNYKTVGYGQWTYYE